MKSKAFIKSLSYDSEGQGTFFICTVTLPSLLSDPKDPILSPKGGLLIDRATELYLAAEEFSKFFIPFPEKFGGQIRSFPLFMQQFDKIKSKQNEDAYPRTIVHLIYEGPALGLPGDPKDVVPYPDKSVLFKQQGGIFELGKDEERIMSNYKTILASHLENMLYKEELKMKKAYESFFAFEIRMCTDYFYSGWPSSPSDDQLIFSNYHAREGREKFPLDRSDLS